MIKGRQMSSISLAKRIMFCFSKMGLWASDSRPFCHLAGWLDERSLWIFGTQCQTMIWLLKHEVRNLVEQLCVLMMNSFISGQLQNHPHYSDRSKSLWFYFPIKTEMSALYWIWWFLQKHLWLRIVWHILYMYIFIYLLKCYLLYLHSLVI